MKPNIVSLTFAAAVSTDAPKRFSGVAYSGGVIPHYGWMGDVAIDLGTLQNPQGDELPVLIDHNQSIDGIAGKGRIFRAIDADGLPFLAVEGELIDTEAGGKIAALFASGFPVQLSVGIHANVRETSGPVQINGRTLNVTAVFENASVREISFVAVGADPETRAHAFSKKEITAMPEPNETIEMLKARIAELEAQLEAQRIERRRAELAALFETVGRDLPKDDRPYLEMSDAAFAAFAADLKAVAKPARDAALFAATSLTKAAGGHDQQEASRTRMNALMAAIEQITA